MAHEVRDGSNVVRQHRVAILYGGIASQRKGRPDAPPPVTATDLSGVLPLSAGSGTPRTNLLLPHALERVVGVDTPGTLRTPVTPVTDITDATPVTDATPIPSVTPVTAMAQEYSCVSPEAPEHRATVSPGRPVPAAPSPVPPAGETVPTLEDEESGLHIREEKARADPLWPLATSRDGPDTGEESAEFLL